MGHPVPDRIETEIFPPKAIPGPFPKDFHIFIARINGDGDFYELRLKIGKRVFKGYQFTGFNSEMHAKRAAKEIWEDMKIG